MFLPEASRFPLACYAVDQKNENVGCDGSGSAPGKSAELHGNSHLTNRKQNAWSASSAFVKF